MKVDQKMFNAVKVLIAGGATIAECSDYMGISTSKVKWIKTAETLEEYRNILAALGTRKSMRRKQAKLEKEKAEEAAKAAKAPKPVEVAPAPEPKPEVVETKQTVMVQTSYYVTQKMDKLVELLTSISKKLAYICEDLYGSKEDESNG